MSDTANPTPDDQPTPPGGSGGPYAGRCHGGHHRHRRPGLRAFGAVLLFGLCFWAPMIAWHALAGGHHACDHHTPAATATP